MKKRTTTKCSKTRTTKTRTKRTLCGVEKKATTKANKKLSEEQIRSLNEEYCWSEPRYLIVGADGSRARKDDFREACRHAGDYAHKLYLSRIFYHATCMLGDFELLIVTDSNQGIWDDRTCRLKPAKYTVYTGKDWKRFVRMLKPADQYERFIYTIKRAFHVDEIIESL